ncbi:MAG: hypothetical protein P1P65_05965 [Treponema sp.]
MIIIEKRKFIGMVLFSFLLVLATAVWAYHTGMRYQLKSNAELALFFGFMGAGFQIFLLIGFLRYSKQKENDFSMVMKAIKLNGVLSQTRAKKLGNIGFELQAALDTAHEITAQKSIKIASLNGLIAALIGMIDQPIIIVNLAGEILDFSVKGQEAADCKKGDMLSQVFPAVSIKEIFQEADLTRLPVEKDGNAVFVPVFSARGDLSYFLVDMSNQDAAAKLMSTLKQFTGKEHPEAKNKKPFFKLFKKHER